MIKLIKVLFSLFLVVLLSQVHIGTVFADVGPAPIYAQGGTLQSSLPVTNVSMDYEKVVLIYGTPQRKIDSNGKEWGATMPVHVSAVFKMKNNSSQTEKMNVYFPASDWSYINGRPEDDGLTNFKVNGNLISNNSQTHIPTIINGTEEKILAYQWQETFNPQQTTEITVEYDSKSGKDYDTFYLTYVLGTGRGWQGTIKQGEINFILPGKLASYSVVNNSPGVKPPKIPFTISGNKITMQFSEYEPDTDDVILLNVYEFNDVNMIEKLKSEPQTFANTLKIAGLFRKLSGGPHCAFCTGKASQYAEDYYTIALDKAASKDDLNGVLRSFAYGDDTSVSSDDLLKMLSLRDCKSNDIECKSKIYINGYGGLGTPFALIGGYDDLDKGLIGHSDFLIKYANKIHPYDPNILLSIKNYINDAKEVGVWYKKKIAQDQANSATTSGKPVLQYPPPIQNNTVLIIGVLTTTVSVLLIALFWIERKQHLNKLPTLKKQLKYTNESAEIDKRISENKLKREKEPS